MQSGSHQLAHEFLHLGAEIASLEGRQCLPVEELFTGPGKSILKPRNELLIGFYLPAIQKGDGSAFRRVMRPQGVAIAIMNMGIWIKRLGEVIQDIRISIGPAGPIPFRARAAEASLRGKTMQKKNISEAIEAVLGRRTADVPVWPTKSMLSNTGAAAGALDVIAAVYAMKEGRIPAAKNCDRRTDGCNLNIVTQGMQKEIRYVLSCSYTYGGQTAAIIIKRFSND